VSAALSIALAAALSGCTASVAGALAVPAGNAPGASDDRAAGAVGSGSDASAAGLTDADGYIATGTSLGLDSDLPAVTKLDPALLSALTHAETSAEQRGTTITVADGWRSERYQEYLFQQAVHEYGSEEEAEKWVKRGSDSEHVSGHAVDIATADAMDFLSRFGSEWGLCQTYANEAWHFELRTDPGGECPAESADGRS
jgi:hypothetical protein